MKYIEFPDTETGEKPTNLKIKTAGKPKVKRVLSQVKEADREVTDDRPNSQLEQAFLDEGDAELDEEQFEKLLVKKEQAEKSGDPEGQYRDYVNQMLEKDTQNHPGT